MPVVIHSCPVPPVYIKSSLTHWGWVTHIGISKFTIIGSDNGLVPSRRQAIIWTNAELMLIGLLGTHLNEIIGVCIWRTSRV